MVIELFKIVDIIVIDDVLGNNEFLVLGLDSEGNYVEGFDVGFF